MLQFINRYSEHQGISINDLSKLLTILCQDK